MQHAAASLRSCMPCSASFRQASSTSCLLLVRRGAPRAASSVCPQARLRSHRSYRQPFSVTCEANIEGGGARALDESQSSWDKLTQRLVSAATVVFFFLLVPQIIKNAANLANGEVGALVAVAWVVSSVSQDPCLLNSDSFEGSYRSAI